MAGSGKVTTRFPSGLFQHSRMGPPECNSCATGHGAAARHRSGAKGKGRQGEGRCEGLRARFEGGAAPFRTLVTLSAGSAKRGLHSPRGVCYDLVGLLPLRSASIPTNGVIKSTE